ncbi:hypothetical protein HNQ92_000768 [Rhabdobacter roseus]|uniref:Glycosyl hydrolase family 95 N-terminal domain-containing protein n=1 Tax=Rhabdobacter roseus TaxID=1655419 RepID=A0A840TLI8_9BACT|nr:glycoside hydrolase N-terminal domain-containing protein [Rhabdobacter roseus]MBB5282647.1 hypothetical protein [Rhabdobacter roseus]
MKKSLISLLLSTFIYSITYAQVDSRHNMSFPALPTQWDEALPLGNARLGALIWQKGTSLRFSLDQAELWDLRPMEGLKKPTFTYEWVREQVEKKQYGPVQQQGDAPYDREPAPSKIPGAALEWNSQGWGKVTSAQIDLATATAEVLWESGVKLTTYVHANMPYGSFRFENLKNFNVKLIPPAYQGTGAQAAGGPVEGDDLRRLGYEQGVVQQQDKAITYRQMGWGDFYYTVSVRWKQKDETTWEGAWSISAHAPEQKAVSATIITNNALTLVDSTLRNEHLKWWRTFWEKSAVAIPDPVLEKQYYLEQYKWGSAARRDAPPISLQAVWTADNGRIPPWKGDFHHDLNTQLSYWPGYAANHLEEGLGYLDHLDNNRDTYRDYTQWYFQTDGLNVPGVTTLTGEPMGGWIQYSMSPTVSAWLAQHYYLHWRYSMDREFLEERAYPWFRDVATFLEGVAEKQENGKRQLPLSSSPEINDNKITAWFTKMTNYDVSLVRFVFSKAAELAEVLDLPEDAEYWREVLAEFPTYALSSQGDLMIAPQFPYKASHRHFSHLLAIHPLGEIRWENGAKDQRTIKQSLAVLDQVGPSQWTGYSYAWQGNLKARAKDGKGAAKALKTFAEAFCSPNSFHLNGDQTKSGKSSFTYRPFTLEGNFAFAAGIQEMLLQSYAGAIEVFPAVPAEWKEASFQTLRAEGAFLVSATRVAGQTDEITIRAEQEGTARLKMPFKTHVVQEQNGASVTNVANGYMEIAMQPGGSITLKNGYE